MNKNSFNRKGILTLVLVFILVLIYSPGSIANDKVNLNAGTIFYVKPIETLDPNNLNTGDSIDLVVIGDVSVDDFVVIRNGTPVLGTVTNSQTKGALGKAAKLSISIDSVEAVDGTIISLSGSKSVSGEDKKTEAIGGGLFLCAPMLLMSGEDAVIPANVKIEVRVVSTYKIKVNLI